MKRRRDGVGDGEARSEVEPTSRRRAWAGRPEEGDMEARILIVDDDPWTPEVVSSALRDGDYVFSTARDGCVALAKALREPPQLVISGVRMPGMSGWRLVRKLRAHRRLAATPFIFLTDMKEAASRRHGFRVGADDYLSKPCDPRELALRVASALRRSRSCGAPGPTEARGFSGAIEDISLASLLVLLEMEHKTGMLVLSRRGSRERCRLFLREGHLVAAFLDGDPSRVHRELLYEIVGWSAGVFEFKALPVEMRDEVGADTTHLLMEALRRSDEQAREEVVDVCGASGEFM